MNYNIKPGSSSIFGGLSMPEPYVKNQTSNLAVGISAFTDGVIRLPKSLGEKIQSDYQNGKFECFGEKPLQQLKGYELVLWVLETIYNRTIWEDRKWVELDHNHMGLRFGQSGRDNKKKERIFTWTAAKKFCQSKGYIKVIETYRVNHYPYKYQINKKYLAAEPAWYYRIQTSKTAAARARDEARYNERLVEKWKDTKRMFSTEVTKINLQKLVFDMVELDQVCKRFLNISVDELLKWEQEVKSHAKRTHSDARLTPALSLELGSKDKGKGYPNMYHSDPSLLEGRKLTKEEVEALESEHRRKQQIVRSLISLRLGLIECNVHPDDKGGRIYSPIVFLKREARKALRYLNEKGELERLINFDIRSCQPWILGVYILKECLDKGVKPHPDVYRYLELVEGKDLYYEIVDFYNLYSKYLPSGRDYTKEEKQEARAKSRDDVKKEVLTDFYRNFKFEEPITYGGKFIKENFPGVWYWILDNKGKRRKSALPVNMQRFEADFFIDRVIPELTERGIWCLTIHDSVVVREKDQSLVLPLLKSLMRVHFLGREQEIKREELFNEDEIPLRKSA